MAGSSLHKRRGFRSPVLFPLSLPKMKRLPLLYLRLATLVVLMVIFLWCPLPSLDAAVGPPGAGIATASRRVMSPRILLRAPSPRAVTDQSHPLHPSHLSPPHWQNRYDLVHVVRTRFMQFQPTLVRLARARLQLFKVFCLPLIRHKSDETLSFLWTIRIDPQLDGAITSELLGLLEEHGDVAASRVIVIASNENPHFVHEQPNPSLLLWGSLDLWQSYYDAAMGNRTVVETRLDADDGLSGAFVRQMQRDVHNNPPVEGVPRVYCVRIHLEWEQEPLQSSRSGLEPDGILLGLRTRSCVTPGLTYVYPPGSFSNGAVDRLPTRHHQIHTALPPCRAQSTTACLVRLGTKDDAPLAIRARTITSAGMMRVVHGYVPKPARSPQLQDNAWRYLMPEFGVTRDDVRTVKLYLEGTEMSNIISEALDGQCTVGHSCKIGSKLALEELRHLTSGA